MKIIGNYPSNEAIVISGQKHKHHQARLSTQPFSLYGLFDKVAISTVIAQLRCPQNKEVSVKSSFVDRNAL